MKNLYNFKSPKGMYQAGAWLVAALLVAGCATTPPPTEQMAVSRAAVTNATSTGASEFAAVPLKSAMDKMSAAERAMTDKDYVLAKNLAEQAQVDADLAAATARSAKAQKAANAVQEDNRVLRNEIDRKTK